MTDLSPKEYVERLFAYVDAGNTEPTDMFCNGHCEWFAAKLATQPELAQKVRDVGHRLGSPILACTFKEVAQITEYVESHRALPRHIDEHHCDWLIQIHLEPRSRPDLAAIARVAADRLRAARLPGARPAVVQSTIV